MSPNARISLLLVGLPLTIEFATVARTGMSINVDLTTESAGGGGFFPSLYELDEDGEVVYDQFGDPVPAFPTDVCQNLGNIKVITEDNEWCGGYDEDACANSGGTISGGGQVLLKVAGSTVTSRGTAVAYDVCAWDPAKSKCRAASYSYFCHTSCPEVPQDRARSSSSAAVTLQTETRSMSVPCQGGILGDFGWCVVTVETQSLSHNGRRLAVSDPVKKTEKRRMQSGGCTPMSTGQECCEGEFPLSDPYFKTEMVSAGPRSGDPDIITVGSAGNEGQGYTVLQYCKLEGGDDCNCVVEDSPPIANDMCSTASSTLPAVWGANGARRLSAKSKSSHRK